MAAQKRRDRGHGRTHRPDQAEIALYRAKAAVGEEFEAQPSANVPAPKRRSAKTKAHMPSGSDDPEVIGS